MIFLLDVPNIRLMLNGKSILELITISSFKEEEDKVTMCSQEYIQILKRGFTCDIELEFYAENEENETQERVQDKITDLVLVHIRRLCVIGQPTKYEYVFYK